MTESIYSSPAAYRDIVLTASSELEKQLPEKAANDLAHKIARRFCDSHTGNVYRVPVLRRAKKLARDAEIRELAKTMDSAAIAKKLGLADRWVREIIRTGEQ